MGAQHQGKAARPDDETAGIFSRPRRPRHLRWVSGIPLAMALAALVLQVQGVGIRTFMLAFLAMISASWPAFFGPLRTPTRSEPLDEREQLLRTRAMLAGANTTAILALIGAMIFANGNFFGFGLWQPATDKDWFVILSVLVTTLGCVPTLYASWTTRPIDEEEE